MRLGIPTASNFHRLITAKKMEPAAGRHAYSVELVTELIIGQPLDSVVTPAMLHGTDSEAKAVAAYEFEEGLDTAVCGFCTTDDGLVGASPDRFVGDDGSLEVKCPFKPEIHVGYLLAPDTLREEYWVQVQGQLYVSGRKWTDLISYMIGLPMVRVRITPDPKFQEALTKALGMFLKEHSERIETAKREGWIKPAAPVADHSADFISDADVDAIVAAQKSEFAGPHTAGESGTPPL